MKKHLVFVAAMIMLPTVYAAGSHDQVTEKPLVGETLDSFNQESARIREQMQPGGVYGFMKSSDKDRVERRLGDMQKLLQDHATGSDLPRADKVALVNAQEEVNGILRHNDANRMVCESRAPVGSHIPVTTCRTYGEIENQRRASLNQLNDLNNQSRLNPHGN
ncbi:MAG: hypothetical protein P4L92_05670 [Rudaea sp.]|nr:hypothetical protein [Rudaea sp.]